LFVLPPLLGLHPQTPSVEAKLAGPGAGHVLGADNLGRDLLARVLSGAHISLAIGFGSVLIAGVIGIPIGMFAAYIGGAFSAVATFIVDVILAFPGLILALALTAFIGPSFLSVLVAITVPMMPVFARLAKIQTASVLQREYVEASRVIGTPMLSILRRDVLPNIAESMIAFALVSVGTAIMIEAGLSFLGLGVPPPQPSWGSMIADGQTYLESGPQMIIVPAAFLVLTIVSLNLLSDRFLSDQGGDKG
jgi:peptide/nickel transport system permease protein